MTRTADFLAILFADVAKSTHLYETLGDRTAKNLIDACISALSKVTVKYHGTVIKTIGDKIMCTFPTANNAVEAAVEMHQSLDVTRLPENPATGSPNIYVGFQFGKVIKAGGDVFGDAVNVASLMVALAKSDRSSRQRARSICFRMNVGSPRAISTKPRLKAKAGESVYMR